MTSSITSAQHPLVKHLVRLRKEKAYREECRRVLVTGISLVSDLAKSLPLRRIFISSEGFGIPAEETIIVTDAIIKKVSGLQNPEGIIAEVDMPLSSTDMSISHLLVIDGVSDPGNLGTLLRTALALGWDAAFVIAHSVDPYNDKALRSAKGATFQLPLYKGSWDDMLTIVAAHALPLVVANIKGENPSPLERVALVVSNEARGLSPDAENVTQRASIPMCEGIDSLNVAIAGGILMYALRGGSHG